MVLKHKHGAPPSCGRFSVKSSDQKGLVYVWLYWFVLHLNMSVCVLYIYNSWKVSKLDIFTSFNIQRALAVTKCLICSFENAKRTICGLLMYQLVLSGLWTAFVRRNFLRGYSNLLAIYIFRIIKYQKCMYIVIGWFDHGQRHSAWAIIEIGLLYLWFLSQLKCHKV